MAESLESTEFLPHVDPEVSPSTRTSIEALIRAERPSNISTHPLLPAHQPPNFPASMLDELNRLATDPSAPAPAPIDLSRYEMDALEAPADMTDTAGWRTALRRSYASSTYVAARNTNLALLETYGRNAWLVGNDQTEAVLKALERELADVKARRERVDVERRRRQEEAAAEMRVLEESWKKAVGGQLDVQVATERLRGEILERRRLEGGE